MNAKTMEIIHGNQNPKIIPIIKVSPISKNILNIRSVLSIYNIPWNIQWRAIATKWYSKILRGSLYLEKFPQWQLEVFFEMVIDEKECGYNTVFKPDRFLEDQEWWNRKKSISSGV